MSTNVRTFRWNPTVASYVLYRIQHERSEGRRTGVQRFQQRHINTATSVGWECRITATDAGFEFIANEVTEVLTSEGIASAAPFDA